jgi:hypothetical protein
MDAQVPKNKTAWLDTLNDGRILSQRELVTLGAHPQTLRRMVDAGKLSNPGHGLYQVATFATEFNELEQFAIIAKIAPTSIIWLLSAAQHHGITQVMPDGIYAAVKADQQWRIIPGGNFGFTEVRVSRLSNERNFSVGIERTKVFGIDVSITSPARTIVDMWRYSTLNPRLSQENVKIDEETFFDAMAAFSSKYGEDGLGSVTSIADEFRVLERMMPHLKSFEAGSRMMRP